NCDGSAASRIMRITVGTSSVWVTRWRLRRSRIWAGAGSRSTTQWAPDAPGRYTQPVPAVWNMGDATSTVDSGVIVHGVGRARWLAIDPAVSIAPLGTPVVPDV